LCFPDRVLQPVCPDWPWTTIFLFSTSQVARITGVSHRHLAPGIFLNGKFHLIRNRMKGSLQLRSPQRTPVHLPGTGSEPRPESWLAWWICQLLYSGSRSPKTD
jgi:hypothetical protein